MVYEPVRARGSPGRDGHRVNLKKQFLHNHLRRITVTVPTTVDAGAWLGKRLEGDDVDTDLVRSMLATFAEALMSAQASMQCNAGYGERTDERENSRNGYRMRPWDTRVGTIELAVRSCARVCTRLSSCWSRAGGLNRLWWR